MYIVYIIYVVSVYTIIIHMYTISVIIQDLHILLYTIYYYPK